MTKVTILGQEPTEKKELKKIEFKIKLSYNLIFDNAVCKPNEWDNIILLERSYGRDDGLDLMYASSINSIGCLYLGHFNDGIV